MSHFERASFTAQPSPDTSSDDALRAEFFQASNRTDIMKNGIDVQRYLFGNDKDYQQDVEKIIDEYIRNDGVQLELPL